MGNFLSAAVRHLGLTYKILAMLLTSAVIVAIFPHTPYGAHYDYKVGGIWRDSDLVAPYDFAVTKSKGEMASQEQKEREQATLFYHRNNGAKTAALKNLEALGTSLNTDEFHRLKNSIDTIYRHGYLQSAESLSPSREIVVLDGETGNEGHSYMAGDFVTSDDLEPGLLRDSILVPSLLLDETQTQLELQSRLSQLSNTSELVMTGDLIIAKGEEVTEEKGRRIASLEAENDRRFADGYNLWGQMAGQVLLAVIAFVALAALIDKVLMLIHPEFTLENTLGIIMFPFAWLMGLDSGEAFQLAQLMGTKLVTNEFVVMLSVQDTLADFSRHFQGVLTVFVTSFANFATLGMIIGCFKSMVDDDKNELISRNVAYMLLSGILVSLLSAGIAGLFIW